MFIGEQIRVASEIFFFLWIYKERPWISFFKKKLINNCIKLEQYQISILLFCNEEQGPSRIDFNMDDGVLA